METPVNPISSPSVLYKYTPTAPLSVPLSEPSSVPEKSNPFSQSDNYIPLIPVEMKNFVELLSDANLSNSDVDEAMGWDAGTTVHKLQRWPSLQALKSEARLMALRSAGVEKADAYRVYKEALAAEKPLVVDGNIEYVTDHDVRIKAADRIATLLGEKPVSGGNSTTVALGVQINLSSEERELLDAYKRT